MLNSSPSLEFVVSYVFSLWQTQLVNFLIAIPASAWLGTSSCPPCPSGWGGAQANHGGPILLGWDAVGLGRSTWSNTGQWDAKGNLLWGFWVRLLCLWEDIPKENLLSFLLDVVMSVCDAWNCWSYLWSWGERGWLGRRIENTWVFDDVVKPPN